MRHLVPSMLSLALGVVNAGSTTPTQQVINMMTEMKAKGEKMMEQEQTIYSAYTEWVDDETKKLGFEIQTGAKLIEELVSDISKADSDVKELKGEIGELDAEMLKLSGEKADATSIRKTQHAEYLTISVDYSESVDALKRAIQVLSSQNYDRSQAEMLLQKMSTTVPGMPRVLAAFLQTKGKSSLRGDGAPAVAAYEFQAGGIVELLEGLYSKFKQELADVEEAESNSAHQFNLVELHLTNTITKDTSDRDEKAVTKAKRAAHSAKAMGELQEAKAAKASDEKLKAELEATHAAKTSAYEENQKVRVAELEAISKAVEIISSPKVSGSYGKHVNLAQVSLLQVARSHRRVSVKQAVALLARRARTLGSRELAVLSTAAAGNPFEKVIGMIEDLIDKLKNAASAEADHQQWCDAQLKANKLKRNKKTAQANKLTADMEGMSADIAGMGATIDTLVREQSDLAEMMSKATAFRDEEKAQNLATISDAKAGFEAVGKALVILREFYSSQASLLQQVPEMAAYKGQQSGQKGVIGMLEVIETDFSRLRAETEAAESSAARDYDRLMTESTVSKKQKHAEEVQLRLDKDQTEYEHGESGKDLSSTQEELERASTYFEYLKPNCLEVHVNWEERVARRKEEVVALKEAYDILDQKSTE